MTEARTKMRATSVRASTRLALAAALLAACQARSREAGVSGDPSSLTQELAGPATAPAGSAAAPASVAPVAPSAPHRKRGGKDAADEAESRKPEPKNAEANELGTVGYKQALDGDRREAPTRAWFPETFLFEPLVVTDARGAAVVPVRVPDRLTTWRVLALAHARTGAQGGAVASFVGTLPTYVDPVVPPFLVRGDQVRVPIQLVNTTDREVAGELLVTADRAALAAGADGRRTIPAQGSALAHAVLTADQVGTAKLRASLAGSDAVERTIEVRPSGRPVTQTRSGTLAAPRTLTTDGTPRADPGTDRVRLQVFPGALSILRTELAVSTARTGSADDSYALLLAGRAAGLLAALGETPDPAALREASIVAAQRAVRAGRTLDVERASLLAEAALAHPGNPVLGRLGERAVAYLARAQRPDGTFAGGAGWTLQRVLVATAEATRAVAADRSTVAARQRALQVAARAAGAFARTADQVTDGYTAAAVLASGAVSGALADTLRDRVRKALAPTTDGARALPVGEGVVRSDGVAPTRAEATALAVLALVDDPASKAALADLGATLLGGYTIAGGWGDGRVNLVAMQAVLALFREPLPRSVTVTLEMDGAPVLRGTLEGQKLRDVLTLEGAVPDGGGRAPAGLAAPHTWKLVAEPAVPGLGYALTFASWLPWETAAPSAGLELAAPARVAATVGQPVELTLTAVAPSGVPLHVQHALPAGAQVDRPSLDAQVAEGAIERYVAADGALDLYVAALAPGKTFSLSYRAIPTLAGTLHSGASLIEAGPHRSWVPPSTWTVR